MTSRTVAVVGVGLALIVGACGDDDADRTKADYLTDANEICQQIDADRNRLAEEHFPDLEGAPTVAQLQGFYRDFAPLFRDHVDRFTDLEPPDEDQAASEVEAINDAFEHEADVLEQAADDRGVTAELLRTDEEELHQGDALREEFGITAQGCVP
jgi:hypothetical protein